MYINDHQKLINSKSEAKTIADAQSLDYLQLALTVRSAFHNETTYKLLEESTASQSQKSNDLFATDIEKMSHHHIVFVMFSLSREAIAAQQFKDKNVKAILEILLKVYALRQIQDDT